MQSNERFSSMRTTTCSMRAVISVILFGVLEADIAGAADTHQSEQCRTEVRRHCEIAVDADQEHHSQSHRPTQYLDPVNGGTVDIRCQILPPTLAAERPGLVFISPQYVEAILNLLLQT